MLIVLFLVVVPRNRLMHIICACMRVLRNIIECIIRGLRVYYSRIIRGLRVYYSRIIRGLLLFPCRGNVCGLFPYEYRGAG